MLVVLCLFAISPQKVFAVTNGKITYFQRDGGDINNNVYVMDADGSNTTNLTNGGANFYPGFAPDGSKIVYANFDGQNYNITTINPDGTSLNDTGVDGIYYKWLPNSTTVSYFDLGTFHLNDMNYDGSSIHDLGYTPELEGTLAFGYSFSPDSTKAVYPIQDGSDYKIKIIDIDGSNGEVLTSVHFAVAPNFSAEGNTIYFVGTTDAEAFSLYSVGTDGSNETALESLPGSDASHDPRSMIISPDGTKLLYSVKGDANNTADVYTMNVDGSNQTLIIDENNISDGGGYGYGWSPDSTKLVFHGDGEGGNKDIFTINVDGTGLINLTNSADKSEAIYSTSQAWGAAPEEEEEESDSSDQDNISDTIENAAPNSGDANNDGTPDSEQDNVASFVGTVTDEYAVLEVSEECSITAVSIDSESSAHDDSDFSYPTGLMDFTLECGTNGFTADITQYYYGASGNFVVRKYNPNTKTYTTINTASISDQTIGGQPAKVATYQVKDGGSLDLDGAEDGNIHDPAGLAQTTASLANTGQNTTPLVLLATILLTSGLAVTTYNFNKQRKQNA